VKGFKVATNSLHEGTLSVLLGDCLPSPLCDSSEPALPFPRAAQALDPPVRAEKPAWNQGGALHPDAQTAPLPQEHPVWGEAG